jgi:hypothetical protein
MKVLSIEEKVQILRGLVEGCSIRSGGVGSTPDT